jgi:hypothetical protein
MTQIEMDDLSPRKLASTSTSPIGTTEQENIDVSEEANKDSTLAVWSWVTAVLSVCAFHGYEAVLIVFFLLDHRLLLPSICLTFSPRVLLFFAELSSARHALTPLERFLSLHLGIWLAAMSLALVLNVRPV